MMQSGNVPEHIQIEKAVADSFLLIHHDDAQQLQQVALKR